MKTFSFFNWITGFVVLLSLDFLFEGLIFEILNWNGTTKNDWFFILWWVLVLMWFLYGTSKLFKNMS